MDTLNFSFLTEADDSLETAQVQFGRREYARALDTIARLPGFLARRADALELKGKALQALGHALEAVAVWEELLLAEPENKTARGQLAVAYSKLGSDEVFRDILPLFRQNKHKPAIEALERGPADWRRHPQFHRLKAICHERLAQHEFALKAWEHLLELVPAHQEATLHIPVCLEMLGRLDEAGEGFRRAADRFPNSMVAQFNRMFFEMKQQGILRAMPVAVHDVARLRALSANSPEFKTQLANFRERLLSLADADQLKAVDTEDVLQLSEVVVKAGASLRSIYEQFEPVGNNCEFGLAQRMHGSEPLALFRWTGITPQDLLNLLRGSLSDFDQPSHYLLHRSASAEYILKDTAYRTDSHTQIKVSDISDPDALLAQLVRRQSFLKRKFLETIAQGQRIYVYKAQDPLDPGLMDELEIALSALGARMFLFVMPANPEHPPASVHIASDTRVLGFLSDFMPNTQYKEWDAVVTHAHAHFSTRRAGVV